MFNDNYTLLFTSKLKLSLWKSKETTLSRFEINFVLCVIVIASMLIIKRHDCIFLGFGVRFFLSIVSAGFNFKSVLDLFHVQNHGL